VIVTIHQPEHLPWLGFLDKIAKADLFVVLDTVQYRKNYFQNRNKIRTVQGFSWITVAVKKTSLQTKICDIEIFQSRKLVTKYLGQIEETYKYSSHFDNYFNTLKDILTFGYDKLSDLNCSLLAFLLKSYGIQTRIIKASEMNLPSDIGGSNLIHKICKIADAQTYLSGISGKDYLDFQDFLDSKIDVVFQEFYHPVYKQLHEPFLPCMSSIDLLFNYGEDAPDILFGKNVKRLDYLFE